MPHRALTVEEAACGVPWKFPGSTVDALAPQPRGHRRARGCTSFSHSPSHDHYSRHRISRLENRLESQEVSKHPQFRNTPMFRAEES
jgi:hypothetical protein